MTNICMHYSVCERREYCEDTDCPDYLSSRQKGKWKVIGLNVPNSVWAWHLLCPECNVDIFTEFTSYCPNCGKPMKEIDISDLNMRGDENEIGN